MSDKNSAVKVPKKRGRKPKKKVDDDSQSTSKDKVSSASATNSKATSNNDSSNAKVPKKRGRKPKPKPLNAEPKVPKKRGRKPKKKTDDASSEPKVPKRRGRKPKEQSYGVLSNMDNFKKENDNIIIHLPIKSEAIKNNNKEKELLKYNPDLTEPAGYEENIMGNGVENYQFINAKDVDNKLSKTLLGKGPEPMSNLASYPFDEKFLLWMMKAIHCKFVLNGQFQSSYFWKIYPKKINALSDPNQNQLILEKFLSMN